MKKPYQHESRAWLHLYKTSKWQKLRLYQLKREPLCRFCKAVGVIKAANTVDHIIPHKGDLKLFFDPNNLQSLDSACHNSIKKKIENRGDYGCDENGLVPSWKSEG